MEMENKSKRTLNGNMSKIENVANLNYILSLF